MDWATLDGRVAKLQFSLQSHKLNPFLFAGAGAGGRHSNHPVAIEHGRLAGGQYRLRGIRISKYTLQSCKALFEQLLHVR